MENLIRLGSELTDDDRAAVLARYVNRFTGDHKPKWTNEKWIGSTPPLLQFQDDADWLANTDFYVLENGRLDTDLGRAHSRPTWPNGRPSDSL